MHIDLTIRDGRTGGGQEGGPLLPAPIADQGEPAGRRFVESVTANIHNDHTRAAYARAIARFFRWCEAKGIGLRQVEPVMVSAYIEEHPGSRPTVKQHLAAIRMLFDRLVTGQVVPFNPAASVRGPKHVVKKGRTPALRAHEARKLLDSIDTTSVAGLRDRALIAVMVYSFARIGATLAMRVEDYYSEGRRGWVRLHEKGGKLHQVQAHHNVEAYLDAYLEAAGIAGDREGPLFRTIDRHRRLTANRMSRHDALKMIKRRAKAAGLPPDVCNHTFRATGITAYLDNGGTIENAQAIACHESPKTTKLYDRVGDQIALDEVERILI
jgi:site-specific recombinase XerD